jgi:hypothetical protein
MPALKKAKYELFAQELAKGHSAAEAYITAGYRPSHSNAGNLRNKKEILGRVAELLELRDKKHVRATEKAIARTALTKEWVITHLMENALQSLGKAPVKVQKDEHGHTLEMFERNPTAANRALELLGRELNMFIERHEVGDPGEFARMSDAELNDMLGQYAKAVGLPDSSVMKLVGSSEPDSTLN